MLAGARVGAEAGAGVYPGEVWLFLWMPWTIAKFHVALSIVCFANLEFLIDVDLWY